jgi:hypothetical protein
MCGKWRSDWPELRGGGYVRAHYGRTLRGGRAWELKSPDLIAVRIGHPMG